MAICALLVLRIFRGARKKGAVAGGPVRAHLPEGETAAGALPAGAAAEQIGLRRQIATALQSNPDQVKQLFSSWLEEGEE
jgi:hypothetical protein